MKSESSLIVVAVTGPTTIWKQQIRIQRTWKHERIAQFGALPGISGVKSHLRSSWSKKSLCTKKSIQASLVSLQNVLIVIYHMSTIHMMATWCIWSFNQSTLNKMIQVQCFNFHNPHYKHSTAMVATATILNRANGQCFFAKSSISWY